jgi:hypothetical protein
VSTSDRELLRKCDRLAQFMSVQQEIIKRHIDEHKWYRHISDTTEAVAAFSDEYGWLIREVWCRYTCPIRNQCTLSKSGAKMRAITTRLFRIWCWAWYAHDRDVPGRSVEICGRCGAHIVGDA